MGQEERARFGHLWAGLGLTATWLSGVLLIVATERPWLTPWVIVAAVLSSFAQGLAAVLASRQRPARIGERIPMLAILAGSLALTVWKNS